MARRLILAVLAATLASAAWAQGFVGVGRIEGGVELGVDIADLSALASARDARALERLTRGSTLLLVGSLAKPTIVSDEPFEAVVEFLEGRWVDGSRLVLHRVFAVFQGEAFVDFLDGAAGGRAALAATNVRLVEGAMGPVAYFDVVSARALR